MIFEKNKWLSNTTIFINRVTVSFLRKWPVTAYNCVHNKSQTCHWKEFLIFCKLDLKTFHKLQIHDFIPITTILINLEKLVCHPWRYWFSLKSFWIGKVAKSISSAVLGIADLICTRMTWKWALQSLQSLIYILTRT